MPLWWLTASSEFVLKQSNASGTLWSSSSSDGSSSVVSLVTGLQIPLEIAMLSLCRCGQILFHLRDSIFFLKHRGDIRNVPVKGARCAASPGVASKQWSMQMSATTASRLRNKILQLLDKVEYGTMLFSILVWPDFKEPWEVSPNSIGPGDGGHKTCTSICALTLILLIFSILGQ